MEKRLLFITVFASLCLLPDFIVSAADNGVTYSYPSENTLVIEGNGVVPEQNFEDGLDDEKYMNRIKKIVIKEGITGLGDSCFARYYENVETIELPATLRMISKWAFLGCVSLRRINLPSGITEIPEGCFEECSDLRRVAIPDTVTKIEKDAFRECGKLKELVLSKQLTVWENPIRKCPQLETITNCSGIEITLDDCKGNKVWYSEGKKVTKLGAGKIAKSKGRKYKISYDLLGGKRSGKLPSGNIMLRPFWVKYKIRAVGNRSVEIFLDDRDAVVPFGAFDVRYSTNKNMKDATYFHMSSEGKKQIVRKLQKGKPYYFQVAYTDNDMEEWGDTWVGKRRIVVG